MKKRASEKKPKRERLIGQHWLEVAYERWQAGEDELSIMRDYGYKRIKGPRGNR